MGRWARAAAAGQRGRTAPAAQHTQATQVVSRPAPGTAAAAVGSHARGLLLYQSELSQAIDYSFVVVVVFFSMSITSVEISTRETARHTLQQKYEGRRIRVFLQFRKI